MDEDCKRLQLVSVNCNTVDVGQKKGESNEHSREDKSQTNRNSEIIMPNINKSNEEID